MHQKLPYMKYFICLTMGFCDTNTPSLTATHPREISKNEQAVNHLIAYVSKKLSQEYKLHPCGTAVAMPGGTVRELGLEFQVVGPLTKDTLRQMLVEMCRDFNAMIDQDSKVRPYLQQYPFGLENIEITLYLTGKKGEDIDDPNISIASIRGKDLTYKTYIINERGIPKKQQEWSESYDEACSLLSKPHAPPTPSSQTP